MYDKTKDFKYLNYWLYGNVHNIDESKYNTLTLYQKFKELDIGHLGDDICENYIENINSVIFSELE